MQLLPICTKVSINRTPLLFQGSYRKRQIAAAFRRIYSRNISNERIKNKKKKIMSNAIIA